MESLHSGVINVFTILRQVNSEVLVFMVMTVHATAKPISHLFLFFFLNLPKGHEIFLCADSKNGDPEICVQKPRGRIYHLEFPKTIKHSVYNQFIIYKSSLD